MLDGTGRETALLGGWNRRPAKLVVPAVQLLSNEFDVSAFRGKIVLVGESSTAGKDLYATPIFRFRGPGAGRAQLSGVEIHAVALNSILSGRIIRVMGVTAQWSLSFLFIVLASGAGDFAAAEIWDSRDAVGVRRSFSGGGFAL